MLAMFIKAADLYFDYGAAIPIVSPEEEKKHTALPALSLTASCPTGCNVLFVIWSVMR